MKQLLFYEKPVALSTEAHRDLRLDTTRSNLAFARETNSVILAGVEFVHAAKEYSIVFARTGGDKIIPLALLGLRNDENLFVNAEGKWDALYVPAFVRRYPFVLAESTQNGEMAVCIDEGFAGFNREHGTPLFNEQGGQSELLTKAVEFLQDYQAQGRRTEIFTNRLKDLDLLTELTARTDLTNGQRISMGGLLVVDEKKLVALDKKPALELFRSGELGWIYAHLLSLSNISRLAARIPPAKPA